MPPAPVDEAPVGFWPRLVEQVRPQLRAPALAMFVVSEDAPVVGTLRNGVLYLEPRALIAEKLISKQEVLQIVGECASGILGRPVRVRVGKVGEDPTPSNENFDRLIHFGQTHGETVDIID